MSSSNEDQKSVIIERTLTAPATLVWSMWTEPEHFSAWYGPEGAKVTVKKMDVTIGGPRLVGMAMEGPDGTMHMWFVGEHTEIVKLERLAYTESMSDETGNVKDPSQMPDGHPETTTVVVELSADGDDTKMVMTHQGVPADSPGAQGWNMAFDKLEPYLATQVAT